jgi:hypothetical protein
MNAARRTLGCWLLAAFLERGADPTTRRTPRPVYSFRPLSPRELAELNPFVLPLIELSNLRRLPRPAR